MKNGDAGEENGYIIRLQEAAELVSHICHTTRIQLIEALKKHDRFADNSGSTNDLSTWRTLLVLESLIN